LGFAPILTAHRAVDLNDRLMLTRNGRNIYAFIPALRRYQPVSSLALCSETYGMDFVPDDYRTGFDEIWRR
jgi:hypothetical protein